MTETPFLGNWGGRLFDLQVTKICDNLLPGSLRSLRFYILSIELGIYRYLLSICYSSLESHILMTLRVTYTALSNTHDLMSTLPGFAPALVGVTITLSFYCRMEHMQVYEIPHPNLDVPIKYKILTPQEVDQLQEQWESYEQHMRTVLEAVVVNLKSDITNSLRKISKDRAKVILASLFYGCVMLNPGLDIDTWLRLSSPDEVEPEKKAAVVGRRIPKKRKLKKISRVQFLNLERHLSDRVIGQDVAIHEVVNALKRSQVGLNDERRPLGVFLFAGASGVGKTHFARELHNYLFGTEYDLVRVDCGEYQHKHENSKLIGAPPGYLGYDDGGHLTNLMKKNSNTVVLLDEVEKAHPDVWNTFLRVFDEGILTDGSGKEVSFRDSIIIMTTNLGNRQVVNDSLNRSVGFADTRQAENLLPPRERVERLAREAIQKLFNPEFLNRLDKTVVFNHLTKEDFEKISELELAEVNTKLGKRGFSLAFDPAVVDAMVLDGMSSVQGARRLAQIRRDKIEDKLADCLLAGRFPRGTVFQLSLQENEGYVVTAERKKPIKALGAE